MHTHTPSRKYDHIILPPPIWLFLIVPFPHLGISFSIHCTSSSHIFSITPTPLPDLTQELVCFLNMFCLQLYPPPPPHPNFTLFLPHSSNHPLPISLTSTPTLSLNHYSNHKHLLFLHDEMEQGPQLLDGILKRSSCDQEAMVAPELHQGAIEKGIVVLQTMSLVHYERGP